MSARITAVFGIGICGVALLLAACEDKKSASSASAPDVPKASEQSAVVDPGIAKAIAAASDSASSKAAAKDNADGPPATGFFTKERADATHSVDAPPFLEVATLGSEPRVSLMAPNVEVPKTMLITVATLFPASSPGSPRLSLPTIDFTFGLSVEKPKAKQPDGDLLQPAIGTMKVTSANPSAQQPGQTQLSAEQVKEIAKLKDSKLGWTLESDVGFRVGSFERASAAQPNLEHDLLEVAEALSTACIAVPSEPVGVGATWISRSRSVFGGLDLVSYRVAKVVKVQNDAVSISVESRQYFAGDEIQKAGLSVGSIVQFESRGEGEVLMRVGRRFPIGFSFVRAMNVVVHPDNGAENQLWFVSRSTTTFQGDGK